MNGGGGAGALSRRDFLRRTVRGKERVLELSCERLYVRWIDARAVDLAVDVVPVDPARTAETWEGEPPLEVGVPAREALLAELDARLRDVGLLRVTGREWLAREDFRVGVERVLEAFRRRGGRVE